MRPWFWVIISQLSLHLYHLPSVGLPFYSSYWSLYWETFSFSGIGKESLVCMLETFWSGSVLTKSFKVNALLTALALIPVMTNNFFFFCKYTLCPLSLAIIHDLDLTRTLKHLSHNLRAPIKQEPNDRSNVFIHLHQESKTTELPEWTPDTNSYLYLSLCKGFKTMSTHKYKTKEYGLGTQVSSIALA